MLIQQILVVDHFGQNIHTHSATHGHQLGHAGERISHVVEDDLHTDLSRLGYRGAVLIGGGDHVEDLKLIIVGVLNIADVGSQLVLVRLDVGLEGFQIVLYGGGECADHSSHGIVHVDHSAVPTVFLAVRACLGHGGQEGGGVLGLFLNGQGVGRQGVLLHQGYVCVDTVGQSQDQGYADDTDRSCKGGHEGAPLLGHEVVEGEVEGRPEGHGGLLALLHVGLSHDLLLGGGGLEGHGIVGDESVAEFYDTGGVLFGQLGIVGDHDDQLVLGDLTKDLHDLHTGNRVQSTRGLVGQKNIRIVDDGAGNGHALHLTARHLVGLLVELISQTHLFQRLCGSSAALGLGDARQSQCQLNVGQNGLVGDEVVALEDKADAVVAVGVPIPILEVLGGFSVDEQVTVGVAIQTANDVE